MTMASVSDGGLQFNIDFPKPEIKFDGEHQERLSWYQNYLQNSYDRATENFRAITESLRDSLKGQERFYLPVSDATCQAEAKNQVLKIF